MFVKTISGHYCSVASVEQLTRAKDESGGVAETAHLTNGRTEQLCPGEIRRLVEAAAQPFVAAPDTYVLQRVVDENNRATIERVPVLAWIVSPERGVLPITIEGVNHGLDEPAAVLMPNGEVVVAMTCTYASQQCYVAELRAAGEV